MEYDMNADRFHALRLLRFVAITWVMLMAGAALPALASDGYTGGYHATGIDGTTVYLNDLEDHTWTYYNENGGIDAIYGYPSICEADFLTLGTRNGKF